MKGYIYTTGAGADPSKGTFNDPIFSKTPTLGACMPNIRRAVVKGDYIFVVSGRVANLQQFVVGGLKVEEKISALAAYGRFPENRLMQRADGRVDGNVIVDSGGQQHPLDHHQPDSLGSRLQNYIVGSPGVVLETPKQIELGRLQTLEKLSSIMGRPNANRVFDVIGRCSKLDENQVASLLTWLQEIRTTEK